jgi:hypothetical protein
LIAGPDWRGEAPAGATLIHAPGNWVWLLVRTLITGRDDLQAVHRLQDSITLKAPADPGYPASVDPGSDSAENFIAVVNQALAHNPPPLADKPVLERIAKVGIAPGAGLPDARILEAWRAGFAKLKPGLNAAAQARQTIAAAAGWSPSPPDLGDFGTNYGLRALVAHVGLAALPPAEVVYSKAVSDNTGSPLQADQHYRWHIPAAGLPVNAFWSLSAYEVSADGAHFFADNAIHRYSIGDRTDGLVRNADGSLDILIQHEAPQGALAANWLPLPAGPVRLFLRAYQPRPELAQGKYHFPVLERLP